MYYINMQGGYQRHQTFELTILTERLNQHCRSEGTGINLKELL